MKESGRGTCLRVAKGGRWPDVLVNIFFFYFLKQPYFVILSRFWNFGVTTVFDLCELDAYMYSVRICIRACIQIIHVYACIYKNMSISMYEFAALLIIFHFFPLIHCKLLS